MPQLDPFHHPDILDHLPQGVCILSKDGTIVFWNYCLEEWTGLSKSTVVGHSLVGQFPQLGSPKYASRLEPLFEGGPPTTFASQFHPQFLPCFLPNGQPRIQQTIAKAIWNEITQEWQALIMIQDISNLHRQVAESQRLRKQAQAEIRERERHEQLLEAIRHIESTFISTKNTNQTFDEILTQLLDISESVYGFIGEVRYQGDIPYLKTHAITNIAWNEETREIYDRYAPNMEFFNLNTLFGKVLTTKKHVISNNPQSDPRRGGLPDGHPPLHAFLGVPIFFGERFLGIAGLGNRPQGYNEQLLKYLQPLLASVGKILHAFHIEQEHQAAQIALEESKTRLDLAIWGTQEGIWDWMDVTQDNEWWSPRFYELLGYAPGEIDARLSTFQSLLHPDDVERTTTALHNHFKEQTPFDMEYRLRTKSGEYRWFRVRGTTVRDESNRPIRMAGSIQDITETRAQEEERQRLSDRLILATGSTGMGIWDWDVTNNVLTWDTTMYHLYGLTAPEFRGAYETWAEGVHPNDRERADKEIQSALKGDKEFITEFRVCWPDQSIHTIAARGMVQRDEEGNPIRMIGVNWDITSQKNQEENRLHLQRAIAQGDEGVALLNKDGEYTYLNSALAEMHGYTVEDLLGQSWKMLYSQDQLNIWEQQCFPRLRDSGKWQGELFGLRKNGTNFPVDVTFSLLFHEDNSSAGLVCTCRDITERKNAEEKFRLVVEAAPSGMIMVDRQGKIILISNLVTEIFGYSSEELLDQSIELLVPERCRPQHPSHRLNYFENPQPRAMGLGRDIFGLRKDGTEFPVEIGLNPLNTKEGTFVLVSVVDITQRKKDEAVITQTTRALEQQNQELAVTRDEALAAARSKSEFLATMSHEIRTPLNGVIGMTELLISSGLDADRHDMVETIKHSGEFLLTIINDILDFSKIDAGKLHLEIIDFDIRTAIDEVLDILSEKANQKNLELIGIVYASTPQHLRGDPGRIRQILFNLLGNAIKFTNTGEVVLDVSVLETDADTTTIRFAVNDTGIGIQAETQRQLFESFTQADSSTTRKFGGTGLGLAICKQLVSLMGGEIGVISEKGEGSTFWFTLPFPHSSLTSPGYNQHTPLQGRRACIIESNDTIRFLLQHYTNSWGMACEVARNGEEGLALLQQRTQDNHPFDVAILDNTFSKTVQEDGLSLAKHIRQTPELSTLPLVLLTTLGQRGEGKLALETGFNGYLTKPIRHHQLRQCLQMVLSLDSAGTAHTPEQTPALITRHTVEEAQAQMQMHILLAEDNVVNQKVAVRILKKLGHRVDVVVNGKEAVLAVDRTKYDLVLMDCQMPEMDGWEATRKIRKAEREKLKVRVMEPETDVTESPSSVRLTPQSSHLPIIALTANALSGDRETCLQAGMDDFLAKPVGIAALRSIIQKWFPHQNQDITGDRPMLNAPKENDTLPPCLDSSVLANLKNLGGEEDPEFFLSVVDQFLADLPRYENDIQLAVEKQSAEALVNAAHTCKGSARSIGAYSLADVSHDLEQQGRKGEVASAPDIFKQWLMEKERTLLALQLERNSLTPEVKSKK